jgi:hypothetical protein
MDASVLFDGQDGHLLEYLAALPHEARPDTGVGLCRNSFVPIAGYGLRW